MDPALISSLIEKLGPALGSVLVVAYFGSNVFKLVVDRFLAPVEELRKEITKLREENVKLCTQLLGNQYEIKKEFYELRSELRLKLTKEPEKPS
jgi:hypothetical protein